MRLSRRGPSRGRCSSPPARSQTVSRSAPAVVNATAGVAGPSSAATVPRATTRSSAGPASVASRTIPTTAATAAAGEEDERERARAAGCAGGAAATPGRRRPSPRARRRGRSSRRAAASSTAARRSRPRRRPSVGEELDDVADAVDRAHQAARGLRDRRAQPEAAAQVRLELGLRVGVEPRPALRVLRACPGRRRRCGGRPPSACAACRRRTAGRGRRRCAARPSFVLVRPIRSNGRSWVTCAEYASAGETPTISRYARSSSCGVSGRYGNGDGSGARCWRTGWTALAIASHWSTSRQTPVRRPVCDPPRRAGGRGALRRPAAPPTRTCTPRTVASMRRRCRRSSPPPPLRMATSRAIAERPLRPDAGAREDVEREVLVERARARPAARSTRTSLGVERQRGRRLRGRQRRRRPRGRRPTRRPRRFSPPSRPGLIRSGTR